MMLLGQNQRKAQRPMDPIVALKQQTIIGCWNVRTTAEATWTAQVAKEMAEYGIEVRQGGVAIMISARGESLHGMDTDKQKDH